MKLSFVVPVFNDRPYLEACVASLLVQGLEPGSYEIVLVDDGSTDGSGALCDALSGKHAGIRVIHQENKGVSEARNVGIGAAVGAYICLVDADDEMIPGGLAPLLLYCERGYDLVRYWCEMRQPGKNRNPDRGDGSVCFEGTGREYMRSEGLETICCNYLYRKSFLTEHGITFLAGLTSAEDFAFMFDVLLAEPKMIEVAVRIYVYNVNPKTVSTDRSAGASRQWVKNLLFVRSKVIADIIRCRESDPLFYRRSLVSLDEQLTSILSRILSSRYSLGEYKALIAEAKEQNLIFFTRPSGTKAMVRRLGARAILAFPRLYPFASLLYRKVFINILYPIIDKGA